MDKEIKDFCHKYDAYVGPSHKMHRRAKHIAYSVWQEDPDIFQNMTYEDVRCVEVHMPEDRFRALLEHNDWLYKAQMSNYIRGNEAIYIVEQHERETRIRHETPAVRAAYEKYQTLLRLVDSHYD